MEIKARFPTLWKHGIVFSRMGVRRLAPLQGQTDGSLFLLVNSHWEAFHTCALTALADCQQEVSSIWETLRQDSRQMQFQGSLFDLCSPSSSPRISAPLAALALPLVATLTLTWPNWCSV